MNVKPVEFDVSDNVQVSPVVRVVVCGEVSSGKSTLMNAVLREHLLPDNLGSEYRPTIFARYRETPGVEVVYGDGREVRADRIDDPAMLREAVQVVLWSNQPHLAGMEIIEVPMTKAEEITPFQVELVRSASVFIWMTIASQAWRLTEKTMVEQFGDVLPKHCILAVSRADKLRNSRDRDRLKDRLVRETSDIFRDWVFINGSRRKISDATQSRDAWTMTGGAKIISRIAAYRTELLAEATGPAAVPPSEPAVIVDFAAFRAAPTPHVAETGQTAKPLSVQVRDKVRAKPVRMPTVRKTAPAAVATPAPVLDTVNPGLLIALQSISEGLVGALAIGLIPRDQSDGCVVIAGDPAHCRKVGDACRSAQSLLSLAFDPKDAAGPLSGCVLATSAHWLLFQDVPTVGLVFMLSESAAMGFGIAQSTLSRMGRTCELAA